MKLPPVRLPKCSISNPHRESGTRFGLRQTLEQWRELPTFSRGTTRGPLGRLRWSLFGLRFARLSALLFESFEFFIGNDLFLGTCG